MRNIHERIVDFIYCIVTGAPVIRHIFIPVFAIFFLFLAIPTIFLALMTDCLFGLPGLFRGSWHVVASLPILVGGFSLWLWSVIQFAQAKGTPVPVSPPPTVVTGGPYKHVRNPMLSGVFLILFGIGMLLNSVALVTFFTPIFILGSILEFRFIEEPELVKRLGEEYLQHKDKTPMLIPKLLHK
jgi:protein-S-isoprenylcysteine O-methyltransferase Ste14